MTEPDTALEAVQDVLGAVGDLCRRHEISALEDFLESCRTFAQDRLEGLRQRLNS